jgi:mannosyltransferase OCH1-like enzyme
MIPRVFHYVWLGSKPMHPLMDEWRRRWAEFHPGWEVLVWREVPGRPGALASEDGVITCRYPEYLASCPTYAKRSDVWRYHLLALGGGVYLDTDVEPVRPIDDLIAGDEAFAGRVLTRSGWDDQGRGGTVVTEVGCSIMGSAPGHPWALDLLEHVPYQDPAAQLSLAFPYVTEVTSRHLDVSLYEPDVFYPIRWDQYALGGGRAMRKEDLPPECRAVHRWSSCWFAEGLKKRTWYSSPHGTNS